MHPFLNIAISAARKAGDYIIRASEDLKKITLHKKEAHDYVSNVDKTAEGIILDVIQSAYPKHCILAEESGAIEKEEDVEWIIDPLDGTANFIRGFPHYAVSIGVRQGQRIEHGVVYDPIRQELFTASRGQGAQLNNRRLRTSSQTVMDDAMIGTGFPFRHPHLVDTHLQAVARILPKVTDLRRTGSGALDLAYVAAGRLDAYWEMALKPWDIAAGILLVREAGGLVSDLAGGESYLETGDIVAGNPKIFKQLLQLLHVPN
jgi:myo-inositol-1(or 4)-monophosphatase